jgi:anti-sigma factor RsiW
MSRRCDALEPLHSAWVDGELHGREAARFGAHLQQCARCRAAITELRVTQAMVRSLPPRRLPEDLPLGAAAGTASRAGRTAWGRVVARSTAAVALFVTAIGAAAFVAGSPEPAGVQVAVPVDVYVADHLVRAIGGPVSTPALLEPDR